MTVGSNEIENENVTKDQSGFFGINETDQPLMR